MENWIISLSTTHVHIIYALIILLACAEGPILSMVFGVLLKLGYFSFLPIYGALIIGDLLGDVVWYFIGYRYGHSFIGRFGKYFDITEESVLKVRHIFHKHKYPILFISKITNGFGFALVTLMTAGMVKIPFWRYLLINVIGQFLWTGILLSVGYFFGNLYLVVDSVIGKISIVVGFILVIVLFMRYKKYLAKKAAAMQSE